MATSSEYLTLEVKQGLEPDWQLHRSPPFPAGPCGPVREGVSRPQVIAGAGDMLSGSSPLASPLTGLSGKGNVRAF